MLAQFRGSSNHDLIHVENANVPPCIIHLKKYILWNGVIWTDQHFRDFGALKSLARYPWNI